MSEEADNRHANTLHTGFTLQPAIGQAICDIHCLYCERRVPESLYTLFVQNGKICNKKTGSTNFECCDGIGTFIFDYEF